MGVSKNRVPPNHPILIGFSIINHPLWGTTIFGKHPYSLLSVCPFALFLLSVIRNVVVKCDPNGPDIGIIDDLRLFQ